MVRRRRDQAHAGDGKARLRDDCIHLVAGQLTAFAGLGPLRHLDLDFVRVDQIVGRHTEAAAGHLLDGAAARVAIGIGLEALFVFAAFAGIRHSAQAVHGDGQRLVGLFANRSVAHGARGEALDDLLGRLHFIQRNGLVGELQLEQAAQRTQGAALFLQQIGVLLECGWAVLPYSLLQFGDGERIQRVVLAAFAILIVAADCQIGLRLGKRLEGISVLQLRFARKHVEPHPFDARSGAGEVGIHQVPIEPHGLKDLRATIALQRADAHL